MNTIRPAPPQLPLADELAGVVARMSGLLLTEETVETSLSVLSALAHETVPGSSGAGVSLVEGGRRTSAGSTDDRVRAADALQYELDEGPCLTAAATRELVVIDDLEQEQRWPRWTAAALSLGLRATLSTPLVAGDTTVGAIKVYSDRPHAFDEVSRQRLTLFGTQAALLVANAQSAQRAERMSEGLRAAVRDRDLVGMAKGVLMGRHAIDEHAALRMLIARGAEQGVDLAAAARAVVESTTGRRR